MRQLTLLVAFLSMVLSGACAQADGEHQADKYNGPRCIAEFCFDVDSIRQLMTEAELIKRYGEGYSGWDKFSFYCYEVPEQRAFVRFRPYHGEQKQIVDVFVSDVPNCAAAKASANIFKSLATAEGLRIGDAKEKVMKLYGKPLATTEASSVEKIGITHEEAVRSAPFGDTVLKYGSLNDGLLHAEIYLRKEKVSAMLISVSP